MKLHFHQLKRYATVSAWLTGCLFVVWTLYVCYQAIDESVLNPPVAEANVLTARKGKVNAKQYEDVLRFHTDKTSPADLQLTDHNPFTQLILDTPEE